ncbi:formylglycine-generating enzyme family protein, partial [archaeon]|nr:formylglycine-generating enzyme family protein [archaeon]
MDHDLEALRTEVTRDQFQSALGFTPPAHKECGPSCPVEASWHEAVAYCNVLSRQQGLEPCFDCTTIAGQIRCTPRFERVDQSCPGFRLPTGDEWEYLARAGTITAYYSGDPHPRAGGWADASLEPIAWYSGNAHDGPQAVATRRPNGWGLYDMLGNENEWVLDPLEDPGIAPLPPEPYRGVRGGSWFDLPTNSALAVCGYYVEPKLEEGMR